MYQGTGLASGREFDAKTRDIPIEAMPAHIPPIIVRLLILFSSPIILLLFSITS
jgi:hypothetical protein